METNTDSRLETKADVITEAGRNVEEATVLASFAEAVEIPLVSFMAPYRNLNLDHPFHQGFKLESWLSQADLILVIESPTPWFPLSSSPRPQAKIIQIRIDLPFSDLPVRTYSSDLTIQSRTEDALHALQKALAEVESLDKDLFAARMRKLRKSHDAKVSECKEIAMRGAEKKPFGKAWVSYRLSQLIGDQAEINVKVAQQ